MSRKLQLIQLQIPTGLFDRLAKKDAGRWNGKEDDAAGSRHPHGVESAQCSPRPLLLRTRSRRSRRTTIAQLRASLMRMRIWVMRESPLCQFRSHGQRDPQDGKEGQEVRRQLMQLCFQHDCSIPIMPSKPSTTTGVPERTTVATDLEHASSPRRHPYSRRLHPTHRCCRLRILTHAQPARVELADETTGCSCWRPLLSRWRGGLPEAIKYSTSLS